jgi:hypothetical protein
LATALNGVPPIPSLTDDTLIAAFCGQRTTFDSAVTKSLQQAAGVIGGALRLTPVVPNYQQAPCFSYGLVDSRVDFDADTRKCCAVEHSAGAVSLSRHARRDNGTGAHWGTHAHRRRAN